ncbi:fimbrial protein [Vibrio caribbeanicus]|jgi:major type 1 subunit fimbrin (pilin)|uniref:P pilus assembly protein n=1 Tax=Vibrio caribbeanicus ATCC BAA-2122 TaxID=796620 RepID=E3BFK4_9VIBR|nr:fimbrial protein [Vibrio caribbeanicus]EFP98182.1 P pilus assembly protein [Vibrio caribbeanicus ATCC BAA-2122]MCY9843218.1 fimbrial protein [Vibrio caribbeanicus]
MRAKYTRSSIAATLLFGLISTKSAFAENTTNVYFKGEIVESACGLSPDSLNQTIELGQHPIHKFKEKGDRSTPVPFRVKLTDCDNSALTKAVFRFESNPDTTGDLFNVEGGATGIGVRILHNGNPIKNGEIAATNVLVDGTNIASFSAAYEMNVAAGSDAVKAGNAESWALLRVSYL